MKPIRLGAAQFEHRNGDKACNLACIRQLTRQAVEQGAENGPKGRGWLLRWLPARAYDNGVYAVFTNPVGIDDDHVRNGNAMILDPFGEIIAECRTLGDDVVVGLCTPDKIPVSSGRRYLKARRPELFGKLIERTAPPSTDPGWNTAG